MRSLVRLRIALADQPGALARVAAVIADHGGNITAIDVHRAADSAVDDVVVDFERAADFERLRTDLLTTAAGTLLSHQAAHQVDPVVAALQRAVGMVANRDRGTSNGEEHDADLVAAVGELCGAPVVWVSDADEAVGYAAGRFAIERGGAIAVRTADLPDGMADLVLGEAWLLALPDPEQFEGGRVVFVARASGEFTTTEIARIEALMALHTQLARRSC